jgi:hypothetical protein
LLGAQHSQAAVARCDCTPSLAMEGVLERGVLALEVLNGLGSASRRLPLELEHLQVRVRLLVHG